jgi:hypothetical protein
MERRGGIPFVRCATAKLKFRCVANAPQKSQAQ